MELHLRRNRSAQRLRETMLSVSGMADAPVFTLHAVYYYCILYAGASSKLGEGKPGIPTRLAQCIDVRK